MQDIEKEAAKYIRVQTTYYKKSQRPMFCGDMEEELIPWKISTLQQDYPGEWKNLIAEIYQPLFHSGTSKLQEKHQRMVQQV